MKRGRLCVKGLDLTAAQASTPQCLRVPSVRRARNALAGRRLVLSAQVAFADSQIRAPGNSDGSPAPVATRSSCAIQGPRRRVAFPRSPDRRGGQLRLSVGSSRGRACEEGEATADRKSPRHSAEQTGVGLAFVEGASHCAVCLSLQGVCDLLAREFTDALKAVAAAFALDSSLEASVAECLQTHLQKRRGRALLHGGTAYSLSGSISGEGNEDVAEEWSDCAFGPAARLFGILKTARRVCTASGHLLNPLQQQQLWSGFASETVEAFEGHPLTKRLFLPDAEAERAVLANEALCPSEESSFYQHARLYAALLGDVFASVLVSACTLASGEDPLNGTGRTSNAVAAAAATALRNFAAAGENAHFALFRRALVRSEAP